MSSDVATKLSSCYSVDFIGKNTSNISGNFSTTSGYYGEISTNETIIFPGNSNKSIGNALGGAAKANTIAGTYNIICDDSVGFNTILTGQRNCIVKGSYDTILGTENRISDSPNSLIIGANNLIIGVGNNTHNVVVGKGNSVCAGSCFNFIFGWDNLICNSVNSFYAGCGLSFVCCEYLHINNLWIDPSTLPTASTGLATGQIYVDVSSCCQLRII
jgi:hypothetical protein